MIAHSETDADRELEDPIDIIIQKINLGGFSSLDDVQLLSLLVDKPVGSTAYRKAGELYAKYGSSLTLLREMDAGDLMRVPGVTRRQALRLQAAFELGNRVGRRVKEPVFVRSNIDVATLFHPLIGSLEYEELWALYLTRSNRLIERCRLSCGGMAAAPADVKSVLKQAILNLASKVILVHNHPMGVAEPSADDRAFTSRMEEGCRALDILLADHIIITPASGHFSFFNAGLLGK